MVPGSYYVAINKGYEEGTDVWSMLESNCYEFDHAISTEGQNLNYFLLKIHNNGDSLNADH